MAHSSVAEFAGWCSRIDWPSEQIASFQLHTPLELAARQALMAHASPTVQAAFRRRMEATVSEYQRLVPASGSNPGTEGGDQLEGLARAFQGQDMGASARIAASLASELDHLDLARMLLPVIGNSLRAAGHAPIFFARLASMDAACARAAQGMLAATVPEFARGPQEDFEWQLPGGDGSVADPGAEMEAWLASVVAAGGNPPGIISLIRGVEASGVLADCPIGGFEALAGFDEISRAVCRIAAWSMIEEPETHAKYGWSHALTLPQANWVLGRLGLLETATAVRNVIAYGAGFRFDGGSAPLRRQPYTDSKLPLLDALADPERAAACAWAQVDQPDTWRTLADVAVVRTDAHLVKHTLAALEMAAADYSNRALYCAAAARLAALWIRDEPLGSFEDEDLGAPL